MTQMRLTARIARIRLRSLARPIGWVLLTLGSTCGSFSWLSCSSSCASRRTGRPDHRSTVPMSALNLLPFEPMWNVARGGATRVGDEAPAFTLSDGDRKRQER